jgi:hypothetical protein
MTYRYLVFTAVPDETLGVVRKVIGCDSKEVAEEKASDPSVYTVVDTISQTIVGVPDDQKAIVNFE